VVSCVGYKTLRLAVESEKSSYEVRLERNEAILKEVVIRHRTRKITLPWNKGSQTLHIQQLA
jgi:hypothetical protein